MPPEAPRTTDETELVTIASRILVPVSNPATAEVLLRLALSLLAEGGKVIAAYVVLSNEEPRIQVIEALEPVIGRLREEGAPVELVTDVASSVARGILDLAQERAADLIVLGVRGLQDDQIVLGPVVDAVARTAPCNVLVYRGLQPLIPGGGYTNVIVPVDGSNDSRLDRPALHPGN
jgi:nucleotide-binding universal stress UspA family protein